MEIVEIVIITIIVLIICVLIFRLFKRSNPAKSRILGGSDKERGIYYLVNNDRAEELFGHFVDRNLPDKTDGFSEDDQKKLNAYKQILANLSQRFGENYINNRSLVHAYLTLFCNNYVLNITDKNNNVDLTDFDSYNITIDTALQMTYNKNGVTPKNQKLLDAYFQETLPQGQSYEQLLGRRYFKFPNLGEYMIITPKSQELSHEQVLRYCSSLYTLKLSINGRSDRFLTLPSGIRYTQNGVPKIETLKMKVNTQVDINSHPLTVLNNNGSEIKVSDNNGRPLVYRQRIKKVGDVARFIDDARYYPIVISVNNRKQTPVAFGNKTKLEIVIPQDSTLRVTENDYGLKCLVNPDVGNDVIAIIDFSGRTVFPNDNGKAVPIDIISELVRNNVISSVIAPPLLRRNLPTRKLEQNNISQVAGVELCTYIPVSNFNTQPNNAYSDINNVWFILPRCETISNEDSPLLHDTQFISDYIMNYIDAGETVFNRYGCPIKIDLLHNYLLDMNNGRFKLLIELDQEHNLNEKQFVKELAYELFIMTYVFSQVSYRNYIATYQDCHANRENYKGEFDEWFRNLNFQAFAESFYNFKTYILEQFDKTVEFRRQDGLKVKTNNPTQTEYLKRINKVYDKWKETLLTNGELIKLNPSQINDLERSILRQMDAGLRNNDNNAKYIVSELMNVLDVLRDVQNLDVVLQKIVDDATLRNNEKFEKIDNLLQNALLLNGINQREFNKKHKFYQLMLMCDGLLENIALETKVPIEVRFNEIQNILDTAVALKVKDEQYKQAKKQDYDRKLRLIKREVEAQIMQTQNPNRDVIIHNVIVDADDNVQKQVYYAAYYDKDLFDQYVDNFIQNMAEIVRQTLTAFEQIFNQTNDLYSALQRIDNNVDDNDKNEFERIQGIAQNMSYKDAKDNIDKLKELNNTFRQEIIRDMKPIVEKLAQMKTKWPRFIANLIIGEHNLSNTIDENLQNAQDYERMLNETNDYKHNFQALAGCLDAIALCIDIIDREKEELKKEMEKLCAYGELFIAPNDENNRQEIIDNMKQVMQDEKYEQMFFEKDQFAGAINNEIIPYFTKVFNDTFVAFNQAWQQLNDRHARQDQQLLKQTHDNSAVYQVTAGWLNAKEYKKFIDGELATVPTLQNMINDINALNAKFGEINMEAVREKEHVLDNCQYYYDNLDVNERNDNQNIKQITDRLGKLLADNDYYEFMQVGLDDAANALKQIWKNKMDNVLAAYTGVEGENYFNPDDNNDDHNQLVVAIKAQRDSVAAKLRDFSNDGVGVKHQQTGQEYGLADNIRELSINLNALKTNVDNMLNAFNLKVTNLEETSVQYDNIGKLRQNHRKVDVAQLINDSKQASQNKLFNEIPQLTAEIERRFKTIKDNIIHYLNRAFTEIDSLLKELQQLQNHQTIIQTKQVIQQLGQEVGVLNDDQQFNVDILNVAQQAQNVIPVLQQAQNTVAALNQLKEEKQVFDNNLREIEMLLHVLKDVLNYNDNTNNWPQELDNIKNDNYVNFEGNKRLTGNLRNAMRGALTNDLQQYLQRIHQIQNAPETRESFANIRKFAKSVSDKTDALIVDIRDINSKLVDRDPSVERCVMNLMKLFQIYNSYVDAANARAQQQAALAAQQALEQQMDLEKQALRSLFKEINALKDILEGEFKVDIPGDTVINTHMPLDDIDDLEQITGFKDAAEQVYDNLRTMLIQRINDSIQKLQQNMNINNARLTNGANTAINNATPLMNELNGKRNIHQRNPSGQQVVHELLIAIDNIEQYKVSKLVELTALTNEILVICNCLRNVFHENMNNEIQTINELQNPNNQNNVLRNVIAFVAAMENSRNDLIAKLAQHVQTNKDRADNEFGQIDTNDTNAQQIVNLYAHVMHEVQMLMQDLNDGNRLSGRNPSINDVCASLLDLRRQMQHFITDVQNKRIFDQLELNVRELNVLTNTLERVFNAKNLDNMKQLIQDGINALRNNNVRVARDLIQQSIPMLNNCRQGLINLMKANMKYLLEDSAKIEQYGNDGLAQNVQQVKQYVDRYIRLMNASRFVHNKSQPNLQETCKMLMDLVQYVNQTLNQIRANMEADRLRQQREQAIIAKYFDPRNTYSYADDFSENQIKSLESIMLYVLNQIYRLNGNVKVNRAGNQYHVFNIDSANHVFTIIGNERDVRYEVPVLSTFCSGKVSHCTFRIGNNAYMLNVILFRGIGRKEKEFTINLKRLDPMTLYPISEEHVYDNIISFVCLNENTWRIK